MLVEHALSDVIVVGAAFRFHVRFDGDFFGQSIVDRGFRALVALPGPVVHMDASSFPSVAVGTELFVKFIGVAEGLEISMSRSRISVSQS